MLLSSNPVHAHDKEEEARARNASKTQWSIDLMGGVVPFAKASIPTVKSVIHRPHR